MTKPHGVMINGYVATYIIYQTCVVSKHDVQQDRH